MIDLAVVTPSFRNDEPLFADLHHSVLAHTSRETVHHVIVPPTDLALFRRFEGPRCRVWSEDDVMPRRYVRAPRRGWWVNVRRPWPPVRGWVLQQALKIAVAATLDARAVVVADSDVVLVRPTNRDSFVQDGRLGVFRKDDAVHAGMPRHVLWHRVARNMLGLSSPPPLPLPDYVSSFNVWEPTVLKAMQTTIARHAHGPNWLDAVTSEMHVSEFILYGLFVDEVLSETVPRQSLPDTLCHDYWDRTPLTRETAEAFVASAPTEARALMISAKSHTPLEVRRAAIASIGSSSGSRGEP